MGDVIELAVDRLSKDDREELFLKLLTYAGPPPDSGYTEWCRLVEHGTSAIYPYWGKIDVLDTTIQYRHWCRRRGARRRRSESINGLLRAIGIRRAT